MEIQLFEQVLTDLLSQNRRKRLKSPVARQGFIPLPDVEVLDRQILRQVDRGTNLGHEVGRIDSLESHPESSGKGGNQCGMFTPVGLGWGIFVSRNLEGEKAWAGIGQAQIRVVLEDVLLADAFRSELTDGEQKLGRGQIVGLAARFLGGARGKLAPIIAVEGKKRGAGIGSGKDPRPLFFAREEAVWRDGEVSLLFEGLAGLVRLRLRCEGAG